MTIKEILEISKSRIESSSRKALECEILLSHILQKPRIYLHTNYNSKINHSILDSMLEKISLLNESYPIEYITNKVSFYSQEFFIKEGALIPRSESELLVDRASFLIEKYNLREIYEIGIGSGVLSIILALKHRDLKIIATDLSMDALNIAKKNIEIKSKQDSTLQNRINLIHTNLLDGINWNPLNLIISNPPYIKNNYKINKNLSYEPKEALFGGERGDEILRKIINLDSKYLCCEIGFNQAYIRKYLHKYEKVEFYKDYSNLTRGFLAIKL